MATMTDTNAHDKSANKKMMTDGDALFQAGSDKNVGMLAMG